MDAWHTIRVEVTANGHYEAWIDENQGLTDVQHVSCTAAKTGSGDYIEIGVRSTITGYSQYYTNYLAFGQDATATGGANRIKSLPSTGMEICGNGLDDNTDGLTDCQDPGCLCDQRPEICGNGIDDDCDGLADCADPDCLNANPENDEATCSNGIDEDCDGQFDCSDPDCAAVPLCRDDQPYFAMTLVRQVGDWQNCGGGCRQVYFSAYDESGVPLNDVTIKDVETGCTVTTHTDRGQDGHASFLDESPCGGVLINTTYRFYVSSYRGVPVASDVTPDMHAWIGPHNPFHAWQVEFILKSRRDNPVAFAPMNPTYIFDSVEMNAPPSPNNTLLDDFSGIDYDGTLNAAAATMFGQTFVATGNRIISLRAELALPPSQTLQYQASIHPLLADPPTTINDLGPAIGPARTGPANMLQSEWWKQMIVWPVDGPDSVPVEPGQKYFLKIVRTDSSAPFTAFGSKNWYDGLGVKHSGDRYPHGARYRLAEDGVSLVMDVYPAQDKGYYDMVAYIVAATVLDENPCRFNDPVFDSNGDHHVNAEDLTFFENCATGPGIPGNWTEPWVYCQCMDHNKDKAVDQQDFAAFQRCISGGMEYADPACDD